MKHYTNRCYHLKYNDWHHVKVNFFPCIGPFQSYFTYFECVIGFNPACKGSVETINMLPFANPLHWLHNVCHGVSNHQRLDLLLNRLFRRTPKKTSKLRVTDLSEGNSLMTGPVDSPHRGPSRRKMFPFDDVLMPAKNIPDTSPHVPIHWIQLKFYTPYY